MSPRPRQESHERAAFRLRSAALVLAALAAAGSLWYSGRQIEELRGETRRFTRAYAELISHVATDTSSTSTPLDLAVSRLIAEFDFPYAVTDTFGHPLAWRGLGILEGSTDPTDFDAIRARIAKFDRQFEPIPLWQPGSAQIFHYGDPPAVRRLRLLPWIQIGILGVILLMLWWSLKAGLERERGLVWIGMARESAHQFGTPLSSLQGWQRLLAERLEGRTVYQVSGIEPEGTEPEGIETEGTEPEEPDIPTLLAAMQEDTDRLIRITSRFGKIGRTSEGEPLDVVDLVGRVVDYMRRRAPTTGAAVHIQERYEEVGPVLGHVELLEWVVENLLKNALDAMGGEGGSVRVEVGLPESGAGVLIAVEDTGQGIPSSDQRRIFEAGFTRKRRGWGLGLALARRLTEEHGGRLILAHSRPGEGSRFEVRLPPAGAP